ncbi:MAG: N-acetyltransferase, partial [Gammaproteobacteria bacterium]|nr:N-acetyltransferase [Gammaproteobacteria bacterium]
LGDNKLDYYHTFVPNELRGRGIAAILTKAAIEYAQERGLEVLPSCSYVEVFLQRQKNKS